LTAAPSRGRDDDGIRASIHHTARGPMPLTAWLRLPAARLRARLGKAPERPWIVPAAVGWLGRRMRRNWRVLELGSGRSTVWLARRSESVLAFEDNEHWLERARGLLASDGIANVDLRSLPIDRFVSELEALEDEAFDLVVVDFLESPAADRVEAVRVGRSKVRPGGYLLLDDSDRPAYSGAFDLLAGWRRRRFAGVKDGWPQAVETTIFRRPK
jgi:predicted O-methyltransferase YrrM